VGEHLLVNAKSILTQWDETLAFVQSETELTTGKLTIACSDTVMRFCLLPTIERFQKNHPKMKLNFLNRTSQSARDSVINGDADIAIAIWQGDHPKLIHRKMFRYNEHVVVPMSHPLSSMESITAHQLIKENLLLLEERTLSRQLLDDWFKNKQVQQPTSMSLGSVEAQIELTRLGLGAAIVPEFSVPEDLHGIKIKGLPQRQVACFYQRLKPAAQAWFRLMNDVN
jgi:DNA-binding transcriptional LysR family regulator